jgi:GNAT superfamily N-acetyltransferase
MNIRILSSKTNSFLHQFQFFKDSKHIGHCRTVIDKQGAILSDLEIYDQYKKQGFGSHFLRNTEQKLKSEFGVQEISLLAWQPSGGFEVVNFFKKNGYEPFYKDISTSYDDYLTLYDLHRLYKKL